MPESPLLIHHDLAAGGGAAVAAVLRQNYASGEVVDLHVADRQAASADPRQSIDRSAWYQSWYERLPEPSRKRLKCVAAPHAAHLAPSLQRPWRALMLLRDPVDRVIALHDDLGEDERAAWSIARIYRELGGGAPRSSPTHARFADFFNGQARAVIAPWRDQSKLEYWAGMPARGALLRDRSMELLERHYVVGTAEQLQRSLERFGAAFEWDRLEPAGRGGERRPRGPDPETRALIVAHNQLDAELHAHFRGAIERDRPPRHRRRARKPQRRGAVCVLGAPRSGTSLTARVLNLLGVDLGPEAGLMQPAPTNNRTGFWEHEDIANLNEDILATLSEPPPPYLQGWRRPPPLERGWHRDTRLDPHRRAARTILRRDFGDRPLWGWKDPRTCLTLPFWQELVAEMRYVICLRHPLDVAASLQARDGMAVEESLELWRRYVSAAIESTSGQPRICISYEAFFSDWERQAERLAGLLGLAELAPPQRSAIADHLEEGMWHHRRGAGGTTPAEPPESLPAEVADLYAELLAQA